MMTVHEVSKRTGLSVRALQYYDRIGLLCPEERTEAGYRLYSEASLERLGHILLFRELKFPLKDIARILDSPDFDRDRALSQQIELLTLQKEHIEGLIALAQRVKEKGAEEMDFGAFDQTKQQEYAQKARESWGHTKEYADYEKRSKGRTPEEENSLGEEMMAIFAEMGSIREQDPAGEEAQKLAEKLHAFICDHYYECSKEVFASLGAAYGAGGEFTRNIDRAGGEGTGAFAAKAVGVYCSR